MDLSPRKQKILASVVKSYTRFGEPVGSKHIADEIGVSSATVRNEMADLIEMGLLEQPHTSAGRIPSQQGYREYINRVMEPQELSPELKMYFDAVLSKAAFDREKVLLSAVSALADASKFAAVATTPSGRKARITAVQFVQISRRTAMLILMSSAGTMKTKVFHCEFDLTAEIMRIFFRVFNERVTGRAVADITPPFIQTLAISFGELTMLMSSALMALLETAKETMQSEVISSGRMNLLLYPEYTSGDVRRIAEALEDSELMSELLPGRPGRVNVLLGTETGRPEFRESALITTRYSINGKDAGGIALAGPMRMNYPLVVSCLSYVAEYTEKNLTMLMQEE